MTLKEVDSTFTIIERVEPNQIILEASLLSNARLLILTKNETNTTLSIEHYSKVNNNCSELCTLTVIRPQSFVYQRSPLLFGTLDKESWLVVEKESCNIIPVTRLAESY